MLKEKHIPLEKYYTYSQNFNEFWEMLLIYTAYVVCSINQGYYLYARDKHPGNLLVIFNTYIVYNICHFLVNSCTDILSTQIGTQILVSGHLTNSAVSVKH